jgi:hypothetical protein
MVGEVHAPHLVGVPVSVFLRFRPPHLASELLGERHDRDREVVLRESPCSGVQDADKKTSSKTCGRRQASGVVQWWDLGDDDLASPRTGLCRTNLGDVPAAALIWVGGGRRLLD